MTAAKAIKSEGEAVIVDVADRSKLPELVQKALNGKGSLPMVVFVDPGMQKVYGAYGHAELRGQNYRAIFRDAKRTMRDAVKAGTFSVDVAAAEVKVEKKDLVAEDVKIVEVVDRAEIAESEVSRWTSSKGTVLVARLVAIENNDTFIFEKGDGSEIRAKAVHLSGESVQRAREMAGQ